MGTLIDRVHRELTDADLQKITSTYHAWRSDVEMGEVRKGMTLARGRFTFCSWRC
jgi:type I restriction enzyme M protein